jgi:hypothetical protein
MNNDNFIFENIIKKNFKINIIYNDTFIKPYIYFTYKNKLDFKDRMNKNQVYKEQVDFIKNIILEEEIDKDTFCNKLYKYYKNSKYNKYMKFNYGKTNKYCTFVVDKNMNI